MGTKKLPERVLADVHAAVDLLAALVESDDIKTRMSAIANRDPGFAALIEGAWAIAEEAHEPPEAVAATVFRFIADQIFNYFTGPTFGMEDLN